MFISSVVWLLTHSPKLLLDTLHRPEWAVSSWCMNLVDVSLCPRAHPRLPTRWRRLQSRPLFLVSLRKPKTQIWYPLFFMSPPLIFLWINSFFLEMLSHGLLLWSHSLRNQPYPSSVAPFCLGVQRPCSAMILQLLIFGPKQCLAPPCSLSYRVPD